MMCKDLSVVGFEPTTSASERLKVLCGKSSQHQDKTEIKQKEIDFQWKQQSVDSYRSTGTAVQHEVQWFIYTGDLQVECLAIYSQQINPGGHSA